MQLRLTHLWLHNTLLRSGAPCVCSHRTGLQKLGHIAWYQVTAYRKLLKSWDPLKCAGNTSADAECHCFILPQAVKAPRRKEDVAVCVVQLLPHKTTESNDGLYLLVQRPSTGLLAGVCPHHCPPVCIDIVNHQQAYFISAQHACHLLEIDLLEMVLMRIACC